MPSTIGPWIAQAHLVAERWVALLRGINVGGANRVAMADLRETVAETGATGVSTYVQSGNVVFEHPSEDAATVAATIAVAVERRHRLAVPVVVRTSAEMQRIAGAHPDDGHVDGTFLHVVFFDRAPTKHAAASIDPARFEPDRFVVDGREAFVTYPAGSGRSKLTIDVFERAFGVVGTARNMNTVRRLAALTSA